ncbi:hypothetical protein [Clostridium sp. OS1-26]|uniref:beta strand repeat-containing protein n=1 Tax=Clostridium sp. OS1-26 TaxID=3070681 RepID=UPI0027E0AD3A|nr:hypothetical protein [Clostridium sp. OS1-26]WML33742.1 hypothetical protein RCG18_20745 [Clostridium sp. OS1-26]
MKKYFSGILSLLLLLYTTFQGITVQAADASVAPSPSEVTITNNVGKADTIYVTGVTGGDIVTVYNASSGGKVLGKKTVPNQKTDITISITQLGISEGSVYITVTSAKMTESSRTEISYSSEGQSEMPLADNIKITNNSGKSDTIYVSGLAPRDKVNIYTAATGGKLLCSATIGSNKTDATMSISQLGINAGSVYAAVTTQGMHESDRVKIDFPGEFQSEAPSLNNINITNNSGKADTISVSSLASGDKVNVYTAATGGKLLSSATVGSNKTEATLTISQIGTAAGNVYVSVKSPGLLESTRTEASFSAEGQSDIVQPSNVTITNNTGKPDTVYVTGLTQGDKVNVYSASTGGKLLGSAVASSDSSATVSIGQLGTAAGSIYISITTPGMLESSRKKASYSAESQSSSVDTENIVVTNNAGKADTIYVSQLNSGDLVKVYDSASSGNLLASATVLDSATDATISVPQLGSAAGSVYVSITGKGKLEGSRTKVNYSAEGKSNSLDTTNISITNRSGSADTISVTGLSQNDVIKVYDLAKGGNPLGSATVASGETNATISITQLGTMAGSVYISRTSLNQSEGDRVKIDYLAEPKSSNPKAENIIVTNNAGMNDIVQINRLSANDVVKVYDSPQGGTVLGSATVANYQTETTVSIPQLGTDAGSVYVSVTSINKGESDRTQVGFSSESKSKSPETNRISIINNAGMAGTVTVSGVIGSDLVKVYDSSQGGTLLGSGTVGTYDTEVTIPVTQLGSEAGNVFISITSKGKLESDRVQAAYSAKLVSSAPNAANVTVENNAGIKDTVKLVNLQPNDVVKVYDSAQGGNLLGSVTASGDSMEAIVSITQLGVGSGTIYVSLTSTGKTESSRTAVQYNAESQSNALSAGDITIENNSGTSDVITVTGIAANDVVKVYSSESGGSLLGTATVSSGNSQAIVTVSQLGSNAGSVYISVTRSGKTESKRVKADYLAESSAPVIGNISIVNNAIISDTVTVKNLTANDVVKVYDAVQGGNLLGYAIVPANSNEVTVTISQLTAAAGSVYVSVTNFGKNESKRTKADYIAEQTSTALHPGDVSIVNNPVGTPDVITVNNLSSNNLIKVYDAANGGNLIGTAVVSSNDTQVTINIPQLSKSAGSVYITVTSRGKTESSRTKVDYTAEN